MNAKPVIPFIAAALFSVSAHALDCSGGANGGMDATGNQCNDAVTAVSYGDATPSAASLPKAEASQQKSNDKSAALKHTSASRHIAARSKTKQS